MSKGTKRDAERQLAEVRKGTRGRNPWGAVQVSPAAYLDLWMSYYSPSDIVEHALAHLEGSATIRAYLRTGYSAKWRALWKAWADFVTA